MDFETLLYDVEAGVATITMNRPDRMNAYTATMGAEWGEAMARADEDDDVRAVVLTGAGRAFCAGADLSSDGSTFSGEGQPSVDRSRYRSLSPYKVRKPVIAAINGHAIGAGLTYAMQCDIRIVAEDAKLAFAFVRRGVIPELGSHAIVPRVVGLSNGADLLLTGRTFLGREAAELGLAKAALPAAEVLPAAVDLARDIAVNTAPVSVAISKRLLWEGLTGSVESVMAKEHRLFGWVGRQPDAKEGVVSFLEKRDPAWQLSPTGDLPEWPA